jgi:hypothetical protein
MISQDQHYSLEYWLNLIEEGGIDALTQSPDGLLGDNHINYDYLEKYLTYIGCDDADIRYVFGRSVQAVFGYEVDPVLDAQMLKARIVHAVFCSEQDYQHTGHRFPCFAEFIRGLQLAAGKKTRYYPTTSVLPDLYLSVSGMLDEWRYIASSDIYFEMPQVNPKDRYNVFLNSWMLPPWHDIAIGEPQEVDSVDIVEYLRPVLPDAIAAFALELRRRIASYSPHKYDLTVTDPTTGMQHTAIKPLWNPL